MDYMDFFDFLSNKYTAKNFYDEAARLGYDLTTEIERTKTKKQFHMLVDTLSETEIILPSITEFLPATKETIFSHTLTLFHELFNGKYDKEIKEFENKTKINEYAELYDSSIVHQMDKETRTNKFIELKIWDLKTLASSINLSHEYMHGLYFLKPIPVNYKPEYEELLPMLLEKIMSLRLSEQYGIDYLSTYNKTRMNHANYCAKEYKRIKSSGNTVSQVDDYIIYLDYTYLIATIYSERLFDYYKERPTDVITSIDNFIERKSTMNDILDKYNISLSNPNTISSFQKSLKKAQNN